jgi:hypothetical protein
MKLRLLSTYLERGIRILNESFVIYVLYRIMYICIICAHHP